MDTPYTKTTTLISALRILSRDIQSDDGVANAAISEGADRLEELLTLVDGAYDIVETKEFGPDEVYNKKWRKEWMEKARRCGAEPS